MSGKALLIGIDDYGRHINEQDAADALPDLSHCLNDVANVKRLLLNQFGFSSRRIKVLPDRKATRAAIVEQLTWLAAGARDGDHLVFFFSGHGRLDHQRQVLCPHDMSWSPKTFITDADLAVFLRRLPEFCSVEAILDCCYSGQAGERDQALRPKLPPSRNNVRRRPVARILRDGDYGKAQHVLWAASEAGAYGREGKYGLLTHNFCKNVRGGTVRREFLFRKILAAMRRYPQLRRDPPDLHCHASGLAGDVFKPLHPRLR